MQKLTSISGPLSHQPDYQPDISLPGYPVYPAKEVAYEEPLDEDDIDPEEVAALKEPDEEDEDEDITLEEDDEDVDESEEELDVPGSELDDDEEEIGNEDEENNYYSIGGDNHNDLEEDQGE
jgi:hypothetical protein